MSHNNFPDKDSSNFDFSKGFYFNENNDFLYKYENNEFFGNEFITNMTKSLGIMVFKDESIYDKVHEGYANNKYKNIEIYSHEPFDLNP